MAWSGSGVYGATVIVGALGVGANGLNLDLDTYKIGLYDNTITPDFSAATPIYSATGEIIGTGYVAHGALVTATTLTLSAGIATWDSADVSWTSSTLSSVRGAIINADPLASDPLVCGFDFVTTYNTSAGTLLLAVNPLGLVNFDYLP